MSIRRCEQSMRVYPFLARLLPSHHGNTLLQVTWKRLAACFDLQTSSFCNRTVLPLFLTLPNTEVLFIKAVSLRVLNSFWVVFPETDHTLHAQRTLRNGWGPWCSRNSSARRRHAVRHRPFSRRLFAPRHFAASRPHRHGHARVRASYRRPSRRGPCASRRLRRLRRDHHHSGRRLPRA